MADYDPVGVAFVGCGNISGPYAEQLLGHAARCKLIGAFDIVSGKTAAFAEKRGCKRYDSMAELLADPDVEVGLNITTHTAHAEVTQQLLNGGKHIHSEKPIATTREDGKTCVELAERLGLLYSCSPVVILGESQQTLKRLLEENAIGDVREIYAEMNHGRIETWHPDPEAFYGRGAGPLLDVGCYPLSVLVQLFGSIAAVQAVAAIRLSERTIGSGPKQGEAYEVKTPDHVSVLAEFASGVHLRLTTSFYGVKSHQGGGIELHGTKGSLVTQSSPAFNSQIKVCHPGEKEWTDLPCDQTPYVGVDYARGLAELADAIRIGAPLTCPATVAFHVLDVSLSALEAAESGTRQTVASSV